MISEFGHKEKEYFKIAGQAKLALLTKTRINLIHNFL